MTQHFTRDELQRSRIASERGIDNRCPEHLLPHLDFTCAGLERVRAALGGVPMLISSGYRSPALNAAVGGSKTSQHMLAQAADFVCPSYGDPEQVVRCLSRLIFLLGIDQLILEESWVHVSFTLTPRYQVLRAISGRTEPLAGT